MPHIIEHRDASGAIVQKVFDRLPTEGDASRFYAAEAGQRLMVHVDTTDTLPNGDAIVTSEGGDTYLFRLPFSYLVGSRQLMVMIPEATAYAAGDALFLQMPSVDERNVAVAGWTGPASSYYSTYYEEISSSTVRVYGLADPPGVVWFVVPHTSLPATHRNKVIVRDQGDNEGIELLGDGDGIVLRSPDGRKWLVRVDESGNLASEPR